MRKKLLQVLKVLVIIYCIVGIALFYLQEKILFHPEPVAGDHDYGLKGKVGEIFIPVNKFEKIHVVKFFADTPSRGLVLYFHGNMKNIAYYEKNASFFTSRGFDVWMPDYPGYGKSTGKLSEERLYNMALQLRKMADEKFPANKIVVYGKSLGTGIAAYLAANSPNRMLIMETPYSGIPSLFSQYAFIYPVNRMSRFKIPTRKFLENVEEPVLILHGTKDQTIPLREAEKLLNVLKPGDSFIKIEGGRHNDLNNFVQFREAIGAWLIRQ